QAPVDAQARIVPIGTIIGSSVTWARPLWHQRPTSGGPEGVRGPHGYSLRAPERLRFRADRGPAPSRLRVPRPAVHQATHDRRRGRSCQESVLSRVPTGPKRGGGARIPAGALGSRVLSRAPCDLPPQSRSTSTGPWSTRSPRGLGRGSRP